MLPLSKRQKRDITFFSILRRIAPEILLIILTCAFFMVPSILRGENILISHPITVTWSFVCFFSIVSSVIFCHLWSNCKPDEDESKLEDVKTKSVGQFENVMRGLGMCVGCWLAAHAVCILFGAPLTMGVLETTTWASLLATLVAVPNLCIFGTSLELWYKVIICGEYGNATERFLYFQTVGSVLGSWSSAIVIPLDWDRPWQVWPIPCIMGCLIGYTVAVVISCVVTVRETKTAKVQ